MNIDTAFLPTTPVYWSDGYTLYSGYLLLALSLPAGHTKAFFNQKWPRQRIPTRIKVPIVNGLYNNIIQVPYNASIEPLGNRYVAWWYDNEDNLIAGPSALFSVSNPTVVLPAATLTLPTTATATPSPDTLP